MLSEPSRRQAMERARDSGEAAASGKVRLIQENGMDEQAGLVMYLPVYRNGSPVGTPAERRASLIGWVGAPFRMRDLMAGLGGERGTDVAVSIYDGIKPSAPALLFRSVIDAAPRGSPERALVALHRIEVGGRQWTLEIGTTASFDAHIVSHRPTLVAAVGVAISALLAMLVWSLASGRGRALSYATAVTGHLRDSEFRWKYALEGAGEGVWDWDSELGQTVYSQRWKQMLGYSEDELSNQPAEWERLLHPDDAGVVLAILQRYLDSTSDVYEAEYRMACKDGSWRWIRARGMAVTRDAAGKPVRTIGTHADITRQKEQEIGLLHANARLAAQQHRFAVILENSHDAFVAVAADGRITDWNAKAEAMFGYQCVDAIGRTLTDLVVPPASRSAHEAGFKRFVDSGEGRLSRSVIEIDALHRDGTLVPVEIALASFTDGSGYAASAFIRDISGRRQAQRLEVARTAALDEARAALHHAQKLEAVGKLTGGVAHDFNNVLHIIGGNIQLLQHISGQDERLQARLHMMKTAVDRGARLAAQLLSFARRQPLQPVAVNLSRVLRAMDHLLERAIGESITVRMDAAPDGLWNALVDPGQLENVILNLAINARDAMPGGGVLTLTLRNVSFDVQQAASLADVTAGDYVRLALQDTGTGMSQETMEQAFEPFFTTKPVGQGTGLGLSMAYGFAKQSAGHIELDSPTGEGTTVALYLPRCRSAEALVNSGPAEAITGGQETVLVVEDDADVRSTAVATLSALGYRVVDAANGADAVEMIARGAVVDVLFSDVVMPGPVSSTELACFARKALPSIAVLYTSGYTRDVLAKEKQIHASIDLLSKPYSREQLAAKLRQVLWRAHR